MDGWMNVCMCTETWPFMYIFHTLIGGNTKTHKNCEVRCVHCIKVFLRKTAMPYNCRWGKKERKKRKKEKGRAGHDFLQNVLLRGLIRYIGPINFPICEDEKFFTLCQKQIWIYHIFLYVKCFSNIFTVTRNVRTFIYLNWTNYFQISCFSFLKMLYKLNTCLRVNLNTEVISHHLTWQCLECLWSEMRYVIEVLQCCLRRRFSWLQTVVEAYFWHIQT